jgi:hypothetical protein
MASKLMLDEKAWLYNNRCPRKLRFLAIKRATFLILDVDSLNRTRAVSNVKGDGLDKISAETEQSTFLFRNLYLVMFPMTVVSFGENLH